ncbi:hypothetical protein L596_023371 [Steinernema carpocapsae]|uniref:CHK kinase-like domain-containing protein n=1 Tax=Steinernema carpocapsae TaxID=34508 RepID=A0A4U5MDH8_STECR|nr:hypothetical protein L596_023371 [Steinernema carpocapsae]
MASCVLTIPYVTDHLDISKPIGDSPFTIQWIVKCLKASDEKFQRLTETSKVANVTTENISQGKGYLSKVYKVTLTFKDQNEHFVCLKVPGVDAINEHVDNKDDKFSEKLAATCHNRECDFYKQFAPHLDIPVPKIYKVVRWVLGKQTGAVLMQFFDDKVRHASILEGATLEQTLVLAKQLATVHSYSLLLPADQWRGKYPASIFQSLYKTAIFDSWFGFLKMKFPGEFDDLLEELSKYYRKPNFIMYTMADVDKDLGLPAVLNHGDMWTNNILWKKNPDGSASDELAAILDWQIIHEGCMAHDLARFMAFCVDSEVRREHQFQVLQLYHDELVQKLKKNGRDAEFTMDQLTKSYKVNFVIQAMFGFVMGPLILPELDPESPDYEAERAKQAIVVLRAKMAGEDALEYVKEIPEDALDKWTDL